MMSNDHDGAAEEPVVEKFYGFSPDEVARFMDDQTKLLAEYDANRCDGWDETNEEIFYDCQEDGILPSGELSQHNRTEKFYGFSMEEIERFLDDQEALMAVETEQPPVAFDLHQQITSEPDNEKQRLPQEDGQNDDKKEGEDNTVGGDHSDGSD